LMLRSLGATRTQLGATAALRTAPFAVVGAGLAVVLALALSGRFPVGVGHLLELDRGFAVNLAVLAIAFVAVVVFTTGVPFVLERRSGPPDRPPPARARGGLARALAHNGAPPEMAIGTHFAFGNTGSARAAPARPVIAGSALALAVVAALGVFLASTNHGHS